jgi:hypothetical protein
MFYMYIFCFSCFVFIIKYRFVFAIICFSFHVLWEFFGLHNFHVYDTLKVKLKMKHDFLQIKQDFLN